MKAKIFTPDEQTMSIVEIPNLDVLPLFYMFPKPLLQKHVPSLADMPRHIHFILSDKEWLEKLTSDLFLLAVTDLTAYMVWPAFGIRSNMECFSGFDPLWKLAHAAPIWEKALEILTGSSVQDLIDLPRDIEMPWLTEQETADQFYLVGKCGIENNNLQPCIDAIRHARCSEDFENRGSHAKYDFYRKWYHTRTKTKTVSLERVSGYNRGSYMDDALGNYVRDDKAEFDDAVCVGFDAERFMAELAPVNQRILQLRVDGFTYQEIADKLGFSTHSAVLKRLRGIAKKYESYAD